jgi:uncharacterized protein (DUF2235 family)
MPKNIVICCDGTGNQFGDQNSNVVKLYQTLECDHRQIAYYHPGVGTMGSRNALSAIGKTWTWLIGLAFGYGISDNIGDAYQFLMANFEPKDSIYVFGFSRGAYTARALCGMLHLIGLLHPGNENLIPYAIRVLKKQPTPFSLLREFQQTFSRTCQPHFVGLWDTVSSLGWVYNAVHFPGTTAYGNPDFRKVRHAVSIDERRAFFRQNLFGPPRNTDQQDISEVWFAGVHSDVGGSYPESQSQLSKISLQWMLCEAELAGLMVDQARKTAILGGSVPYVRPDPNTPNQHESLRRGWWICEFWPKIYSYQNPAGVWHKSLRLNWGRPRHILPGIQIHPSVQTRLDNDKLAYRPKNLPTQRTVLQAPCWPSTGNASAPFPPP